VIVEGLEVEALQFCAQAMGLDLAARGVEVLNAGGQQTINPLWEYFGPPGLAFPLVCIADADDQTPLNGFLAALKKAGRIAALPAAADRYTVLESHGYFVSGPDMNIEEALVSHAPAEVDAALDAISQETFAQWRTAQAAAPLGKRATRFQARRVPGGAAPTTVSDLTDEEARVRRMQLAKGDGGVKEVVRRLTRDGTDAARMLPSYRQALSRVKSLVGA